MFQICKYYFFRKETPDNVKKNNTLLKGWTEDTGPMYRNITTSMKRELQAESTSLRRNPYYYQIYYVYLNTLFATVLPLSLLLFFNINTAKELIKMSRLGTARSMAVRNPRYSVVQNTRKQVVSFLIATKLAGAILVTCVKELTDR